MYNLFLWPLVWLLYGWLNILMMVNNHEHNSNDQWGIVCRCAQCYDGRTAQNTNKVRILWGTDEGEKMMQIKETNGKYRLSDGRTSMNLDLDEAVLTYYMLRQLLKEKGMIWMAKCIRYNRTEKCVINSCSDVWSKSTWTSQTEDYYIISNDNKIEGL